MDALDGVVYIVEDDESFLKSVVRLVRLIGYETITFNSAHAFLSETNMRYPGCLLLDVKLPDIDGMDLQKVLKEKNCFLPIIFMTGHGDITMSVEAMKQGAVDFLPKPFDTEQLKTAITEAIQRNIDDMHKRQEVERINGLFTALTPREDEVMRYVIAGWLNKQIAFELGTTEKTIKVHRSRVMQKTGVSSVAELCWLAQEVGIVPHE